MSFGIVLVPLALAGLFLISLGAWLVYPPAGVVLAGVECFAVACAIAWAQGGSK